MRKSGLVILGLAAGLALVRAGTRPEVRSGGAAPERELDEAGRSAYARVARAAVAHGAETNRAPTATGEIKGPTPIFARAADLKRFRSLAAKVFVSEGESVERERLLHDAELLRAAGERLILRAPPSGALAREQDDALALLLAAARVHEPAADAALAGVIRDTAVEDPHLEAGLRRRLAGLKAEAMYTWSSVSREAADRMPGLLTGPVAQRIWANVLDRQRSNQAAVSVGRVIAGEENGE